MYNVAEHLEKCVNSVILQDLPFEFEIIMVNDGSTDGSLEKALEIGARISQIKVISQENRGLGGARNTGIITASGKYIIFLDADDILVDNALGALIQIADRNETDVLEFAATGIGKDGKMVYHISNHTDAATSGILYYNKVRYMNSACNKIYRLEFLKRNGLLFKERIYIEDFEFNTRVFAIAEKVLATDLTGAYFLQSDHSITRNIDPSKIKKMQDDIIKVIEFTVECQKKAPRNPEMVKFYTERLGFLNATLFYQLFKHKAPYKEIRKLKSRLAAENLYFPNYPVHDRGKEIFRRILVKNMFIYPLLIKLIR